MSKNIYEHYKNKKLYVILGIGEHTETGETLTVYQGIEDGKIWVRPSAMFNEYFNDGIPRFKYRGTI